MKKILFAALAATFMFASCTKDENDGPGAIDGVDAQVVVKFNAASIMQRAYDDVSGDVNQKEVEIEKFSIFIFSGETKQGSRKNITTIDDNIIFGNGTDPDDKVTTSADKIVLIGNYPASFKPENVTTLSSLNSMLISLDEISDGYENQSQIAIYGTANIVFGTETEEINGKKVIKGAAEITPNPIPARIDAHIKFDNNATGFIGGKDKNGVEIGDSKEKYLENIDIKNGGKLPGDDGYVYPLSFVEFKGVTVLYSGVGATYGGPTSLPNKEQIDQLLGADKGKYLYSGLLPASGDLWSANYNQAYIFKSKSDPTATPETILYGSWNGTWNGKPNKEKQGVATDFKRSYYALVPSKDYSVASDHALYNANTILTAYGVRHIFSEENGVYAYRGTKPIYWPVHFSKEENAAGIDGPLKSGYRYEVTMKFSKDLGGGAGGSETPQKPIVDGLVEVTIKQAQWKALIKVEKPWEGN